MSRIIVDNGRAYGAVDAASTDPSVQGGARRLNRSCLLLSPGESFTAIATVGKGYDGFAVALVIAEQQCRTQRESGQLDNPG